MKKGQYTYADARPEEFEIRKLFACKNIYELVANDDIAEQTVTERDGTERKQYTYLRWCNRANIDGYDDAVAALVALRYTLADEFALSRKDPDSAEYTAYLAYVGACKTFAREFFQVTGQ